MRFSCIIPAFNEWKRIAKVLETLLACEELDEIIVVDDGSTDDTWTVIETFDHPKLTKIQLPKNLWKTQAIFRGIHASSGEYLVTIDSDLLGLTPHHISSLIAPIKLGNADVTISIRENSLFVYKLMRNDFVSGERVIPRHIFDDENSYTSGPGFGLEVTMNEHIIVQKLRVQTVKFDGVITPRKSAKYGFIRWTLDDIGMIRDILSVVPAYRLVYQMWYFFRGQRR